MGLDIICYEIVTPLPAHEVGDGCYDDHVTTFTEFEHSFEGWAYEQEEGASRWRAGCFFSSGSQFGFRAGSYGGYNQWRRHLCFAAYGVEPEEVWADRDSFRNRPFWHIINFSDAEGDMSHVICNRLYHDFADFRSTIVPKMLELAGDEGHWNDYITEGYDNWLNGFALAAKSGMVKFC